MKVLLISGPNLNRLGKRSKAHYGTLTYQALVEKVTEEARRLDICLEAKQSNHEGDLVDWIHESEDTYDAVLINAGALTHYSYAVRDAIESSERPFVEVHLSNIYEREAFRAISVIKDVCEAQFYGEKEISYFKALAFLKTLPEWQFSDKII